MREHEAFNESKYWDDEAEHALSFTDPDEYYRILMEK
jgi:hypothetical protein